MKNILAIAFFASTLAAGSAFASDNNGAEELAEIARANAPFNHSVVQGQAKATTFGNAITGASSSNATFGNDLSADPHNDNLNYQNGR